MQHLPHNTKISEFKLPGQCDCKFLVGVTAEHNITSMLKESF